MKANTVRACILAALERAPATAPQLAARLGTQQHNLTQPLRELVKAGVLTAVPQEDGSRGRVYQVSA